MSELGTPVSKASGDVAIAVTFLEQDGQRPNDVAALLAEFLGKARSTLHLAIYDFRLGDLVAEPVVKALRDRLAAGVEVRVVFDAGKPHVPFQRARADPAPPGSAQFINRIADGIAARAVTGGDQHMPKLMHHKYVIRDGKAPAAALWTGSTNFTDDSWALQENNIVCIDSPALCMYYENDFEELWSRGDIATTGAHDTGSARVNRTTIDVAFSPGQGRSIEHEIVHCIGTARRRLKICSMIITSGAILGAIGDALEHGRVAEYGGVYDRTQMESVFDQWCGTPAEWKIKAFEVAAAGLAGKPTTPYTPNSRHDFMHNKTVIADDMVITGSYNLSHSATENAENVLMIYEPELANRYNAYVDRLQKRYGSGLNLEGRR